MLVIVTDAPGKTAPLRSFTVTRIVPVVTCAWAELCNAITIKREQTGTPSRVLIPKVFLEVMANLPSPFKCADQKLKCWRKYKLFLCMFFVFRREVSLRSHRLPTAQFWHRRLTA